MIVIMYVDATKIRSHLHVVSELWRIQLSLQDRKKGGWVSAGAQISPVYECIEGSHEILILLLDAGIKPRPLQTEIRISILCQQNHQHGRLANLGQLMEIWMFCDHKYTIWIQVFKEKYMIASQYCKMLQGSPISAWRWSSNCIRM